ncbi:MAG: DUF1127 domain-containing protein [Pseudomonadota bacterium]
MAYATAPITARFDLVTRIRAYAAERLEDFARYRDFRKTYAELQELSDRELDDLGIARANLRQISIETVYGS